MENSLKTESGSNIKADLVVEPIKSGGRACTYWSLHELAQRKRFNYLS